MSEQQRLTLPRKFIALLVVFALVLPARISGYSFLTHEAIIDSAWVAKIVPLLRARYPTVTDEDLLKAKSYAYGGSIIQDMGYYPHGSKLFSDLTHYFRSGDFVLALIKDSHNINDYAFALGALAHYSADNNGHHLSTNLAVPMLYPKLQKKYGNVVTYEDDPVAHVKTEFGFDVLEVAQGRYTAENYHNFVGFNVSLPLLEQAFRETYGLELKTVTADEQRAANSYRNTVGNLLPKATRVAWALKKNDIQKDLPGVTKKKFLYNMSRANYQKEWGKNYHQPSAGDKLLAFFAQLLPKAGPLRFLEFRTPTPEAEKLFENSFNVSLDRYKGLLDQLANNQLQLPNSNFDVGEITERGQYRLGDKTCADLLDRLSANHFLAAPPDLRADLIEYFSAPDRSHPRKGETRANLKIQEQIQQLKQSQTLTSSTTLNQ
jgi:Zinc dependent phospholipase C